MKGLLKAITRIINQWLTASIKYHNSLHNLCTGSGTETAILEADLLHKITSMSEAVLCIIFLDLHKAYSALNRNRCLNILTGYGMVPQTLQILQTCWTWLRMVAEAGRYSAPPLQGYRGVT